MPGLRSLRLRLWPGTHAVTRLAPDNSVPEWARTGPFWTLSRTNDELSITCPEAHVPDGLRTERGFRLLQVLGPLDFSLVGVIAGIATPLAEAGVSIVPIGTFDTDYVLVRDRQLQQAISALRDAGHTVETA